MTAVGEWRNTRCWRATGGALFVEQKIDAGAIQHTTTAAVSYSCCPPHHWLIFSPFYCCCGCCLILKYANSGSWERKIWISSSPNTWMNVYRKWSKLQMSNVYSIIHKYHSLLSAPLKSSVFRPDYERFRIKTGHANCWRHQCTVQYVILGDCHFPNGPTQRGSREPFTNNVIAE